MNELTLELTLFFSQFHFLRPAWLLLMIPALAWFLMQKRRRQMTGQWQQLVDPELQEAVIEQQVGKQDKFSQLTVFLALIISSLALAGPTWKRLPQPVVKNEDALIILQDMSYSMAAEDVSPSRAERALQKITDILKTRTDGQTALVSYAGEAYTVTPLTSDQKTILNLLPSLSPFIMPAPGSRPDRAIE
ncbi:MAG: vWA domain-containing protein, partial [Oceanobacter sp.]